MAGRPSRTGKDMVRHSSKISDDIPVAWGMVRTYFSPSVRDRVDDLSSRGGLSLRDIASLTTAQLLRDLDAQAAGEDCGRRVSAQLRLLFRVALASGGVSDASTVLVQVPEELANIIADGDTGDELD